MGAEVIKGERKVLTLRLGIGKKKKVEKEGQYVNKRNIKRHCRTPPGARWGEEQRRGKE